MGLKESGLRGGIRNVSTGIGAAITIDTLEAEDVGEDSATIRGEITELTNFGEDAEVFFEFGEITEGLPNTTNIQLQDTVGVFTEDLTNLSEDTTHEFQAFGSVRDVSDEGVVLTFETDAAIPDAAISQYLSPQFTSSMWPDNISDKDITTISGLTNDETAFGGEGAVVGDGTDDHGTGDVWDHWNNMHQDLSFGVSINTSDANGTIAGVELSSSPERQFFTVEIGEGRTSQFSDAGKPNIFFRDAANGDSYAVGTDDVRVDDGEDTHIGFSKTGNTGSGGIRIYINGSEVDFNVTDDGGFASGGGGDLVDFNEEIAYFAHFDHDDNAVTDHIDATIHEIVTYDEALSESEWADEFNRQPWS